MILYGLKNCDTCRKALKALPQAELVDVSAQPVPDDILTRAHKTFGDAVLNTRSTTWRGLDEVTRALAPIEILRAAPKVMKRPLIADGDALYLGWSKETQTALGVTK